MLATGAKGGGTCTALGVFPADELPTLKATLPALDPGSLNWLRGTIAGLNVRQGARESVEAWVAGLERGFQVVGGQEEEDEEEEEERKKKKKKNNKKKKHVVVWALRDVDMDGDRLESLTPTTTVRFNIRDEKLLSEPWAQSWPSAFKRLRARMPGFLEPARARATTYTVSQSLMCGVVAQSIMGESESLQDVLFLIEPLSSILASIAAGQWLHDLLRELATSPTGGAATAGEGAEGPGVELGRALVVLADPHLACRREARDIMDAFDDLASILPDPSSLRTYPSRREMECEQAKLADVRALDAIASLDGCAWPWRPRTCPGSGDCCLDGLRETVYKRGWSAAAQHIYKGPRRRASGLVQCTTSGGRGGYEANDDDDDDDDNDDRHRDTSPSISRMAATDPGAYWFHQEYVQELAESEFRVFIVCTREQSSSSSSSSSRPRGRVVRVLHTTTPSAADGLLAPVAQPYHYSRRCVTGGEVERFALDVFARLRRLGGGGFESLDVGVRLDIGVHVRDGSGCPFVNEVTRWYCADQFANLDGTQSDLGQLHLTRSFASAFVEWVDCAL
ncbi:hypothetical protein UCDDA912_g10791 [Diaporthe ampelina]|uniref:Uncharacterized protein n=1 Tax=Diaporthe ampelina TaxID=1214573 RepID=A0A0G2F4V9_9PEZI|nr:hypothetical protein UCDDA912_g10791 [Diaporthe ampelina]